MPKQDCVFCQIWAGTYPEQREVPLATMTEHFFAMVLPQQYAVTPGHTLIIPKRHCEDIFSLRAEEAADLPAAFNAARKLLDGRFRADAYNIGVNSGAAAGQTVFHLHLHLIPRHSGDMEDPRGGIIRNLLKGYTPR